MAAINPSSFPLSCGIPFKKLALATSIFLAACSTVEEVEQPVIIDDPPFTADAPEQIQRTPPQRTAQVVENLVLAAGNSNQSRNSDAPGIQPDPGIEGATVEIEPITPTIVMTANSVVERAINDYLQNRRALLNLWVERGRIWFPMIDSIFAEEEVPSELKYLALAESDLNPNARSPVGAAGMWQFMPATAQGEGLRVDAWVDERLDPELSTRAAAKHLKVLYDTYGGNWHLALAGYNCSYRCISRAVTSAGGTLEDPPGFWEIYPFLPQQTRNFIPKFIAAAMIISDPQLYGLQAEDFGQEYSYDVVLINGMLSLDTAAELAGMDVASLRRMNPSIRKLTLPESTEPFPLKIPAGTYQSFIVAFNNLPPQERISPSEYSVQSGDTLGGIATRFATTVAELQATNNLQNHLIFPGQVLVIPGTGSNTDISLANIEPRSVSYGAASYQPILLNEGFQLVEQAGSTPENTLMAVSLSDAVVDDLVVPTIYQVRQGDTLGQIAERFDVSVRDIQIWNNVQGTTIYANQELTLHTAATAPSPQFYRVQRGDNLAAIARRFGITLDSLMQLNGLQSDLIYPGQDLQLN